MNFFSAFAAAFCAASIFIGALYMLCPEGVMQKSVKYIFTLVFILSVVSAAKIAAGKTDLSIPEYKADQAEISAMQTASAEFVFAQLLQNDGVEFSKITVCTDKSETNGISISKVIIWSGDEKERILSALAEAAENIKVEIVND